MRDLVVVIRFLRIFADSLWADDVGVRGWLQGLQVPTASSLSEQMVVQSGADSIEDTRGGGQVNPSVDSVLNDDEETVRA